MNQKLLKNKSVAHHPALRVIVVIILFILPATMVGVNSQAQTAAPGSTPFGADFVKILPDHGLDLMSQTEIRWANGSSVLWSLVEPNETDRQWTALSEFDQELANAQLLGAEPIVLVHSTPSWAQKLPGYSCGPIADDKLAAFGNFMFDLVNRYKDRVKYWEIWNEPDIDPDLVPPDSGFGCWGDQDDPYYGGGQFAAMLQVIYPRIKAADPQAQVLVGGLLLDCDPDRVCTLNPASRFLEGILVNGGASFFDGVAFHAYDYYTGVLGGYENSNWDSSSQTTGPVLSAKADFIRSVLGTYGASNKYLMASEVALVCSANCDINFENTKAYYIAQVYGAAYSKKLRAAMWYATYAKWKFTDLLFDPLTSTPGYYAFKFGAAKLAEAQFSRPLSPAVGVIGYEFTLPDRRTWLVWSLDGTDHTLVLTEVPLAVYDVDGDSILPSQTLVIGKEPYYIDLSSGFKLLLPDLFMKLVHLQNGDFEAGADTSGEPYYWDFVSGGAVGLATSLQAENPTVPYLDPLVPAGSYSALLGSSAYPCASGGVPLGYAAVEQTFDVPYVPDGQTLELRFDYIIYTQDGGSSDQFDRFEVYLTASGTTSLKYFDGRQDTEISCNVWHRIPASGWKTGVIDLISPEDYRGKSIKVSFQNWNRYDGYMNTFTYLDNVRLYDGD
jgi:hypothetical protein